MSAPRDFDPVADPTSYLADDIPVPYYPDQEPESEWMARRLEVVEDFLHRQEVYASSIRQTQQDPVPVATSSAPKGKERAPSPTIKPEPADDPSLPSASSMWGGPVNRTGSDNMMESPPALPMRTGPANQEGSANIMQPSGSTLPTDRAPFVNLAARAETLHISPRAASIEYLASRHPDDADDDDSSDDEPSASKRPRLVSPTPNPTAPPPNYLSLTPSEIDRLLHDSRPFQYRFVYTPDHIRGLAYDVLSELTSFLSFYEPASDQEASARVYLYRAIQSHFNRRL